MLPRDLAADPVATCEAALSRVAENAARVAELGGWPGWIRPDSLCVRVPTASRPGRGGFDAGVASALDLIPRSRQRLAAVLHAAYTPAAVAQVRAESVRLSPDSETTWWLAACDVCEEATSTPERFAAQLVSFAALAVDPVARVAAAADCLAHMRGSFELRDGVPFAVTDGGMQGAYIAGHDLATAFDPRHGLFFIGTFRPSLGLEDFPWVQPGDPAATDVEVRLGRSGPVHGSRQFVKCTDEAEFRAALAAATLG